MNANDVRIVDVAYSTEDFRYRTPIKFGGVVLDRATVLDAVVKVEGRGGRLAIGRGSMPLGNVWSYPSRSLSYAQTLVAMRAVAGRIAEQYLGCRDWGHPVEVTHRLERDWPALASNVNRALGLCEPLPMLSVLVASSPFDAALHDAYGKLHQRSSYQCLGVEFLDADLTEFLGSDYTGSRLDAWMRPEPVEWLPLYHLVGALDPLTAADVQTPVSDGEPESLNEWIARDGLTHLKIKLNGDDPTWDADRVKAVANCSPTASHFSLDFNERCPSGDVLLEFLQRLQRDCPAAYERVQYIEQPTSRDLGPQAGPRLHKVAALKPLVLDEGLVGLESLHEARDAGYNGVALKACKGQTQSLLMAAAAQRMEMFLCVQDLTCPGASFVHSAGLAAHVPGVAAIEGNGRQYLPAANWEWLARMPELFAVSGGRIRTGLIAGQGLGAYD